MTKEIEPQKTDGLTIGEAMLATLTGKRFYRPHWNIEVGLNEKGLLIDDNHVLPMFTKKDIEATDFRLTQD